MFVIEITEYDYFIGTRGSRMTFKDRDEAEAKYQKEKSKDFDYGDHYRTTRMHETKES